MQNKGEFPEPLADLAGRGGRASELDARRQDGRNREGARAASASPRAAHETSRDGRAQRARR